MELRFQTWLNLFIKVSGIQQPVIITCTHNSAIWNWPQRVDTAIHSTNYAINWIEICPVESVINPLNNRSQSSLCRRGKDSLQKGYYMKTGIERIVSKNFIAIQLLIHVCDVPFSQRQAQDWKTERWSTSS